MKPDTDENTTVDIYILTTNQHAINVFKKQCDGEKEECNEFAEPHRLTLINMYYCDYTGFQKDKKSGSFIVSGPSFSLRNFGIQYCKEKRETAFRDMHMYCLKNSIFPLTSSLLESSGPNISVKRSNGKIENDWVLGIGECTYLINEKIAIPVHKKNIVKSILIDDFFELNAFDETKREEFKKNLRESLKKHYGICDKGIEQIKC